MSQITLVTDEHDDNIRVRMVAQFLQPSGDVLVRLVLADIVDKQCADGTAIVGGSNGSITFLTSSIPDLRFDRLGVDLDRSSCEFNTDRRLRIKVEFVPGKATKQVGLANTGVPDQNDWEESAITVMRRGQHVVLDQDSLEIVPLKRNYRISYNPLAKPSKTRNSKALTSYSSLAMLTLAILAKSQRAACWSG